MHWSYVFLVLTHLYICVCKYHSPPCKTYRLIWNGNVILTIWQLLIQPVIKISSEWRHFHISLLSLTLMLLLSYMLSHEYQSIFTAVIHEWRLHLCQFRHVRTVDGYDVTMPVCHVRVTSQIELWWRLNAKSEMIILGENGKMSYRWLF